VVSEPSAKQQVIYAVDPVKGKDRKPLYTGPPANPGQDSNWDVSPDGSNLAFIRGDAQKKAFQIQIRPVAGGTGRELNISGWDNAPFIRWAADGKGWYVTASSAPDAGHAITSSASAWTLLKVDLTGKTQPLIQGSTWADAIPSPDGRHVAMMGRLLARNVWMLENF